MSQFSLEEHLEALCPSCGKQHERDFKIQFENQLIYQSLDCNKCGYTINIKSNIHTCGTFLI